MKNFLHHAASLPVTELEFDNSVTYRSSFSRAAKRPKLSTVFIRSLQSRWNVLERAALIASVVASFVLCFPIIAHSENAPQVGIEIGLPGPTLVEPNCAYGYYDYAPYACAPYGFWGPEYFFHGRFRGSGPWEGNGRGYNHGLGERQFMNTSHEHGYYREPGSHGDQGDQKYHDNHGGDHGDRH